MFMPDCEGQPIENAFDILIPKLRVGGSTPPGASTPFNHIGLLEGEPGSQVSNWCPKRGCCFPTSSLHPGQPRELL